MDERHNGRVSYGTVERALRAALRDTDLTGSDGAARALAITYARQLDGGEDPTRLGPALLAVLTALGMTPAARAALTGKGTADGRTPGSPLDELRARRRARTDGTPPVDATAP